MDDTKEKYRQQVMRGVKRLLAKKADGGLEIKPEHIALNVDHSTSTIYNWAAGRRIPKRPIIERMESIYKLRILNDRP
jgi:hypothetical protein